MQNISAFGDYDFREDFLNIQDTEDINQDLLKTFWVESSDSDQYLHLEIALRQSVRVASSNTS